MTVPVFLLLMVILLFGIYYVIPLVAKYALRMVFLRKTATGRKEVYLTFDDGPDAVYTATLLDALKKQNIKASFFLLGSKAEQRPDLVRRMAGEGHLIGTHGYHHLHPWKTSPLRFLSDTRQMHQSLHTVTGPDPIRYYRPTYGKLNFINLAYLLVFRQKAVFWNIDPEDYNQAGSGDIVDFVEQNIRPGGVILMHDSRKQNAKNQADVTVESVRRILELLKTRGYAFKTVDELYTS
jgi:peptidoglycan-N-acetylglucosamine deacetylase